MLLKPAPVFEAVESIWPQRQPGSACAAFGAGRMFDQAMARAAALDGLLLICGRYERCGRTRRGAFGDEEVSIGDYVSERGELAAAVVIDAWPGCCGRARE